MYITYNSEHGSKSGRRFAKNIISFGLTVVLVASIGTTAFADSVSSELSLAQPSKMASGDSAMRNVLPKAEDESNIKRMFISNAELETSSDFESKLTDDSWDEIEETELTISPDDARTYKECMMQYFLDFENEQKIQELKEKYPNATYDDYGKLIVSNYDKAASLDIRTESNWTLDDFKLVCKNKEIQSLLPVALRIEKEAGVNALYLVSVAICETGWGKHMAGSYNYFNWSSRGVQSFGSIDAFSDYSVDRYKSKYTKTSTYGGVSTITPRVVNKIYAINGDGSVNWRWSDHVCSMMVQLSNARQSAS